MQLLVLVAAVVVAVMAVASQECRPEFASWLKSRGAVLSPHLSLLDLTLSTAAAAGEEQHTLVTIPRELFLVANATRLRQDYPELDAMTSEGRWWDDRNDAFAKFRLEDILLTLQLMHEVELGPDSFFYEYLAQLPQDDDLEQVHEYAHDDLAQFRHPGLIALTKKLAARVEDVYARLFPSPDKRRLFVWANGIVRARAFSNGHELALIPLVDRFAFAVGADEANAELDVSESHCTVRTTTTTSTNPGKVILPNLWPYSNLFILLHRGEVFPGNGLDAFPVNLPKLTDAWAQKRVDKLKQEHLWPVLVPSLSPPLTLVGFFRVAMAAPGELELEGFALRAVGGPALEEVALTACVRQLDKELEVFVPVEAADGKPRQLLAKQYVDSQRELLTRAKTYCQLALQVAQAFPDDDDENETPGEYAARFELDITRATERIARQVYGKST